MSGVEKPEKHLIKEALGLLVDEYESNKSFNEYFDGAGSVVVTSPREYVDPYEFESSKVLFWVDRGVYEDERAAWENYTNQAKHKEVTELIRINSLIAPFQELLEAVDRGRVVPFIGAGMSKPMGMPLWAEALSQLLERLPAADKPAITALIGSGRYLAAAQALLEHDDIQTVNFIQTTYRIQKIKLNGPMLLLPRLAKGCVVTTNFDDAIEQIYSREDIEFSAYMHGTQDHNFFPRLVKGDKCLLKLHGDAENPATYILTEAQYTNAYGSPFDCHKPLPKALRQIFVSQSLLFLGCGLEQDWTLELFEKAKNTNEYAIPSHYAILPAPADAQEKQKKATRLLKLNIQPIWYPEGQHEFVQKYLELIVDVAERRIAFNG